MPDVNADQSKHWNEVVGPRWVALGDQMDVWLEEISTHVLRLAAAKPGEAVLEIGSGTGSMGVRLARAVAPGGHVLGIDISRPMIEAAEARLRREGLGNLAFQLADAQVHPFPRAAFDLAFSRFGVMFFERPAAAFANVRTAMKPGGRLAFVCWGPLARNVHWSVPFGIVVRHLGRPNPRPPHAPGPMAFDEPDYVRGLLDEAGWRAIAIAETEIEGGGESLEQAVDHALTIGPASGLITERNAPPETVARIRDELRAEFARYEQGGVVRLPGQIFLVSARA
ncbi:MAG TPA: methyltransferase domain-containing protein [Acetobacteraceae bacterium]|nr:methyltransferase domain-containing protein [Acetobacteraceae bacterium]